MLSLRVKFVAYEPTSSIGTGNNDDINHVLEIKKQLHLAEATVFLYGGSVNVENCTTYLENPEIDGLLIGSASLDPHELYEIAKKVSENS
jgi:triosephosphate isomerase